MDAFPLPRPLRSLALAALTLLAASLARAQQVVPDSVTPNEGGSGSVTTLKSLYALDASAYGRITASEPGTGNQVASYYATFRVPAGTPPPCSRPT